MNRLFTDFELKHPSINILDILTRLKKGLVTEAEMFYVASFSGMALRNHKQMIANGVLPRDLKKVNSKN